MSELTELLFQHRDTIIAALAERWSQADGRAFLKSPSFDPTAFFTLFLNGINNQGENSVREWVKASRTEGSGISASSDDLFLALDDLRYVLRRVGIENSADKPAILAFLEETDAAFDTLRGLYANITSSGVETARAENFQSLADAEFDFICLANSHGEPFYLNPAARRMLGIAENQPVGTLHEFYDAESWKQLREVAVPSVNKIGHWRGKSKIRNRQTGKFVEMRTVIFKIRSTDGTRPSTIALVHRDLGDRLRLERALAESQSRKRAILESSLDPIITIGPEGNITEFNRAAEQTFGYSRDRILNTKPTDILFPADADPGQKERIERYLNVGEGSMLGKRMEIAAMRSNGEIFPAEIAMTMSHEHGMPVVSFFLRDISQRKKAEEEQARHAEELERSNRELEQFAYVASHDLQEPLRKIRTFSDRLLIKQAEQLDEEGKDTLGRIQNAAERMQSLIDGLLTLSRVTTHGQNFVPVDLAQILQEVTSDLEERIRQVNGHVEIGKLPTIQADALQMRQLFQNLIANGLKFRRPEEEPAVKVAGRYVHGREGRLLGQGSGDEQCRIVVEDNGIGFEEKYSERIFGIFQRLHPRDVYEGTGIGLAICRRIVERHGGTITARSTPGKGTAFDIVLPVKHAKKRPEPLDDEENIH